MTKKLYCINCGAEFVVKRLFMIGSAACPSCGKKNPLRQKAVDEDAEEGELILGGGVAALDEKSLALRDRVMAKNFQWKLLRDKSGYVLVKCKKKDLISLTIPATFKKLPVVAIADKAFEKHAMLTSVTIEDGVKKIGAFAFSKCAALTSVTMGMGVAELGASAFAECPNLGSVQLSVGLKRIAPSTFYRCGNLLDIIIPEGVEDVGNWAFGNCVKLQSVAMFEGVTRIGGSAFHNCDALKCIDLPKSVAEIAYGAFYDCGGLVRAALGGVKTIHEQAFYGCGKLKEVELGDELQIIGIQAFEKCKSLETIRIPKKTARIAHGAFAYCKALKCVELPDALTEIGYRSFAWCGVEELTIGGKVRRICKWAFYHCQKLASVNFCGTANIWNGIKQDAECWKNVPARKVNCTDEKAWLRKK